jgi:asparagine synthase (glutamine-hydrolysing)
LSSVLALVDRGDMRLLYDELLALYRPSELADVYTPEYFSETASFAQDTFAGDPTGGTLLQQVLSMQFRRWLPANINLKQDRLCMAHGIENRVPFLDHHFVEFARSLPDRDKINGRCTKAALRRLASRRLPAEMAPGPKMPFHLPLPQLLGDARLWDMVEDNVNDRRVRQRGFIRPEHVAAVKRQARAGDFLASKKLFAFVILEIWHRIFVDGEALAA